MAKQDTYNSLFRFLGLPGRPLGPGSKEHKFVFEALAQKFSPNVSRHLKKPRLAEALARAGGVAWDGSCESTGDTVTEEGLRRVIAAMRNLAGQQIPPPPAPPPRIGVPFVPQAPPRTQGGTITTHVDLVKLERANTAHASLLNALAAHVGQCAPQIPAKGSKPDYDLAWTSSRGDHVVAEVKSVTPQNKAQQLRLGIGQVVEYQYQLSQSLGRPVFAVLCLEDEPDDDERGWCAAAGVVLTWPGSFSGDLHYLC